MTSEEEVIALRAELAQERAERQRLGETLRVMCETQARLQVAEMERRTARAARNARHRTGDVSGDARETRTETSHAPPPSSSPFPSSFPPSPETPSPYPLSFPPSSPTPDLFGAASAPPPLAKVRKAKKEPTGDPRHAPLVKALTDAGYPFRGGVDAKAVTGLLALADQQEATREELAGVEILRRARIGWAWVGYPSCRSVTELRDHWGRFDREQQSTGPPSLTRGSVRAELMDHAKPQEPF